MGAILVLDENELSTGQGTRRAGMVRGEAALNENSSAVEVHSGVTVPTIRNVRGGQTQRGR
jgi:hypothetical protein